MGLNKGTNTGGNYLTIGTSTDARGRTNAVIGRRCKADDPDAVVVYKKNGEPALDAHGDTVYRQEFRSISGLITKMRRVEREWGGKTNHLLEVVLEDGGETYTLQMTKGDRYWADFLLRMPNLVWDKPVELTPYRIEEDGRVNRGIAIKQGGLKVARRWNAKDGWEGGPPQPKHDPDEDRWLYGARDRWLDENVLEPGMKALLEVMVQRKPQDEGPDESVLRRDTNGEQEEDDLPF